MKDEEAAGPAHFKNDLISTLLSLLDLFIVCAWLSFMFIVHDARCLYNSCLIRAGCLFVLTDVLRPPTGPLPRAAPYSDSTT